MTLAYLLDTNVISELARREPVPGVEGRVVAHQAVAAISAPTVEELVFGVARLLPSARREMLDRWLEGILAGFDLLPFDAKAALWLGRERARLASLGRTVGRADGEIAAIAATNGLILVTRNLAGKLV
ncbi:MAG: PIN domain-containing protein [Magnetospirillum sp. WYHS-4]